MRFALTVAMLLYAGSAWAQDAKLLFNAEPSLLYSSLNKPNTVNISGDAADRIVINRPKGCTMVVLENTSENIVLGCRKEIKP